MKRMLVALLTMVALSSCSRTQKPVALEAAIPAKTTLVFSLAPNSSEIISSAVEQFAKKAGELSMDTLAIEIKIDTGKQASFQNGFSHLSMLSGSELGGAFLSLEVPFLFRNYRHFTMSCNSKEVLGLLEEQLRSQEKMVPLAAFYQGSRHLVANYPLAERSQYQYLSDLEELAVAMLAPGSTLAKPLEAMGFEVLTLEQVDERGSVTVDHRIMLAEFVAEELSSLDFNDNNLYYSDSMHQVKIKWLVADAATYDSLTSLQKAAIEEAAAYLFPMVDDSYLLRENINRAKLRDTGVETAQDMDYFRKSALKVIKTMLPGDPLSISLYRAIEKIGMEPT